MSYLEERRRALGLEAAGRPSGTPEEQCQNYVAASQWKAAVEVALRIPIPAVAATVKSSIWEEALKRAKFSDVRLIESSFKFSLRDSEYAQLLARYKKSAFLDAVEIIASMPAALHPQLIAELEDELNVLEQSLLADIQTAQQNGSSIDEELLTLKHEKVQRAIDDLLELRSTGGLRRKNENQNQRRDQPGRGKPWRK